MALGRHSQIILVLPDLDIVAVMTGTMWDDEYYSTTGLIEAITRAVKSDAALAPNPEGEAILSDSIKRVATEPPCLMPEPPETAKLISGRAYAFADNDLHVKTLTLRLTEPLPSWEFTTQNRKDLPIERVWGLIGLDGRFRRSPRASHGIDAVKGRWISDDTFEVGRHILGHGETEFWVLRFDGANLEAHYENTDGFKRDVQGHEVKAEGD